ncbi:phage protease [Thiomicrorhabdus sp. Kp2]|uniref:phage protease n=1 Tax=Thiomicrorhabdus sp. Kp2 TaxID=1123518 RepID=UPI000422AFAE|nr:phage protease [Thiomicrorhabdus sp. Kp2]
MEKHTTLTTLKALCSHQSSDLRAALNFEIAQEAQSVVPEWIELIPAGNVITGRDGRSWKNPNPQQIVQAFHANQADIPIDIEHATELKAPNGEPAPAIGWIKELVIRDGAVFGRVEWTENGHSIVSSKQYRYLSPVFLYTKDDFEIVRITSIGLTNNHNLFLKALNQSQNQNLLEDTMDLKALAKALGLPENASFEDVLSAANQLKSDHQTALNHAQNPSLDKFVPRADYSQMEQRAINAEKTLAANQAQAINAQIDQAVDQALQDGKIAPATVDYHKAACQQEGGLERFKAFVEKSPVIAADTSMNDGRDASQDKALNAEQQAVATAFGNSAEDLNKYAKQGV